MTWRLQVTHTTRYRYSSPGAQSYNEARLEPRSDRHQAVLSSRVEVEPSTRVVRHVDSWSIFKVALVFNLFLYGVLLTDP